jgi:carboxyl-terminal PDZ ligand of neuronal nitric oxide synthase protein
MPSQPYNLVKDEPDLRVPLHSDESFYTGITFQAKVRSFVISQTIFAGG